MTVSPCVYLNRYFPPPVIIKAADSSSAATFCGVMASGSAERRPRLRKAWRVCDAGDSDSSGPAKPKATRQTAASTQSKSESVSWVFPHFRASCNLSSPHVSPQIILELCRNGETANILTIQPHLERIRPLGYTGVRESVFSLQFPKYRSVAFHL